MRSENPTIQHCVAKHGSLIWFFQRAWLLSVEFPGSLLSLLSFTAAGPTVDQIVNPGPMIHWWGIQFMQKKKKSQYCLIWSPYWPNIVLMNEMDEKIISGPFIVWSNRSCLIQKKKKTWLDNHSRPIEDSSPLSMDNYCRRGPPINGYDRANRDNYFSVAHSLNRSGSPTAMKLLLIFGPIFFCYIYQLILSNGQKNIGISTFLQRSFELLSRKLAVGRHSKKPHLFLSFLHFCSLPLSRFPSIFKQ